MPGANTDVRARTSCANCATPPFPDDKFCGNCGSPLVGPPPVTAAPPPVLPVPRSGDRGPDVRQVLAMVDRPGRPMSALPNSPRDMCLICGSDLAPQASACSGCGSAAVLLSPSTVDTALGTFHQLRRVLRKKPALRVVVGATESVLLTVDGTPQTMPNDKVPPPVASPLAAGPAGLISASAEILRAAVAVDAGQVQLPWRAEQLFPYVFATDGGPNRPLAADLMTLDRPDLLDRCGLGGSETMWLRAVVAARRHDVPSLLASVLALPPDRYRRKFTLLAAFMEQLSVLPNAGAQLANTLAVFADSEPLAGVLRRRLGLVDCDARQRLADYALLATAFGAPEPLLRLTRNAAAGELDLRDAELLGANGCTAVAHTNPSTARELIGRCALDRPAMSILDDLIDAGATEADVYRHSGRSDGDLAYLLARTAPGQLRDDQVVEVSHADEIVRRAHLRDDAAAVESAADCPTRDHVLALAPLTRNRPDDVRLDQLLAEHRAVAERLVAVQRASVAGQPVAAVVDRVLTADRTTWQPLFQLGGADALLGDGNGSRVDPDFAQWLLLTTARERLFVADWAAAARLARRCLSSATSEDIQDEAHNLLACALHHLGDHEGALRALQSAIEGEYSVALLANIGVVASRLDGELAAQQLARVVREAPTLAMRANAARQALHIWNNDDSKIWQGEGDGHLRLPIVLREPLRSIVSQAISDEDFRLIARTLSQFDDEWLRSPQSLAGSPHRDTLAARYYQAVAQQDGFDSAIGVLAGVRDWATAPEWLATERERLVRQTIDYLAENIDDPDNKAGVVALELVARVSGLDLRERTMLGLLGTATFVQHLTATDCEVGDVVIERFRTAKNESVGLEGDVLGLAQSLIELTVRRIAINLRVARAAELGALIDPYNNALMVLDRVPVGMPDWFAARNLVAQVVDACRRTREQLNFWLVQVDNADLRQSLVDLIEEARDFESKAHWVLDR